MRCASCGLENDRGQRYCKNCGSALGPLCQRCGAGVDVGDRFCGSCGGTLVTEAIGAQTEPVETPSPERRLVSILFVDLVGFTAHSERRDPEDVRQLLTQYFDRSRSLIEQLGGTVEKFIGDALMAVWGSPVARENDAERAARAALTVVQAVTTLGEEVGLPELRARAGVVTGLAAVDVGSESEGMVLGDTVNLASRLQGLADPSGVLVDDVTRRASEAAIAYEDTGNHSVKGREQPVRAWRALRVVAGRGGVGRHAGLEAPFTAREHELERVVSTWEATADGGQAGLVCVVGEAGPQPVDRAGGLLPRRGQYQRTPDCLGPKSRRGP